MKKFFVMFLAIMMMAAMMLPAAAATNDFVPSISIKPGPGIVEKPGEDGSSYVGEIVMPDGSVIRIPAAAIIVTPYAEKDSAKEATKTALENAYNELSGADSLDQVVTDLTEKLATIAPDVAVEDLIVSDLFHLEVIGEYAAYIEQGGVLNITYKVSEGFIVALLKTDAWKTMVKQTVTRSFIDNNDGTITVTMSNQDIVAFLKDSTVIDVDPDNPDQSSPVTGDYTVVYLTIAGLFAAVAVLFFVVAKKQEA